MSDWQDFCDIENINSNDPEQFENLLEKWSKEEEVIEVEHQQNNFKEFLKLHSDSKCDRCGGTGYIGTFKRIEDGRCFKCFPDKYWKKISKEGALTTLRHLHVTSSSVVHGVASNSTLFL